MYILEMWDLWLTHSPVYLGGVGEMSLKLKNPYQLSPILIKKKE